MITNWINRHSHTRSPSGKPSSVSLLIGMWFLGLAALHTLYSLSAFLGFESDFTVAERVAMAVGPTMVVLCLLLSQSLFAAGVIRFDLAGRHGDVLRLPVVAVSAVQLQLPSFYRCSGRVQQGASCRPLMIDR